MALGGHGLFLARLTLLPHAAASLRPRVPPGSARHELDTSCPAIRIDDELSSLLTWWSRAKCAGFDDKLLPLSQQASLREVQGYSWLG